MYVTPIIRLALQVSAKAHNDQVRKGSDTPYLVHPVGVMLILAEFTNNDEVLAAALLHDVLEDCSDVYSESQMRREFGDEITGIVKAVTKDSAITDWRARNDNYLATLRASNNGSAIMVCAADKINNLVDVLEDYEAMGPVVWEKFSAGKDDQLWWYNAAYELIADCMPDHRLTKGLNDLVDKLALIVID